MGGPGSLSGSPVLPVRVLYNGVTAGQGVSAYVHVCGGARCPCSLAWNCHWLVGGAQKGKTWWLAFRCVCVCVCERVRVCVRARVYVRALRGPSGAVKL